MEDGSLDDISVIATNNTKDEMLSKQKVRNFKGFPSSLTKDSFYGSVYQNHKTIQFIQQRVRIKQTVLVKLRGYKRLEIFPLGLSI